MSADVRSFIRAVPDFPKPGILFHDITPALQNADCYAEIIHQLLKRFENERIDYIAAIESRGYLLGAPLATQLHCGLVLLRKPNKLPFHTIREEYALEYGSNALEVHQDAIFPHARVLIVDDLLATGGTAVAACKLMKKLQGDIIGTCFMIELKDLNGRTALEQFAPVTTLLEY